MKIGRINIPKAVAIALCTMIIFFLIILWIKPAQEIDVDSDQGNNNISRPEGAIDRFSDLRVFSFTSTPKVGKDSIVVKEDIITFTFNEGTDFGKYNDYAKEILEKGKNPGLGVREIHSKGITGKGVRVAIIDQSMHLNHPELKGKVLEYFVAEDNQEKSTQIAHGTRGSMHGPAVTSLLAGETIGTAPGVQIYYAEVSGSNPTGQHFADSLRWIIEKNRNLPENDKIRIVSVSYYPLGLEDGEEWMKAVSEARENNILVLDVSSFIGPCHYDIKEPDNFDKVKPGFAHIEMTTEAAAQYITKVLAPTSRRTLAEQYADENASFHYDGGSAGISWAVPYAAGVLALGWEIKPELSPFEIVSILMDTVYRTQNGYRIINPPAFIKKIQQMN